MVTQGAILAPAVALVVALDTATTTLGLAHGAEEAVPGSAWVLAHFGQLAMHAVAIALWSVVVLLAARAPRWRRWPVARYVATYGAWCALWLAAAVVAHNFVVMGRVG